MRGGFQRLYDKLAEMIAEMDGEVNIREVTGISPGKEKPVLITAGEYSEEFDRVLFTGAAPELKRICYFPDEYNSFIDRAKHKANICMTLILDKPVSKYYWITVAEKDAPFVLFIEHTNLIKDSAYEGKTIVYLSRYLDESNDFFTKSNEGTFEIFINYLRKLFPDFDREAILDWYINRAQYSQPVVYKNHSKNLLPFETPQPGLFIASMAQIYPEDRGQNYAVALGKQVAELIPKPVKEESSWKR